MVLFSAQKHMFKPMNKKTTTIYELNVHLSGPMNTVMYICKWMLIIIHV